MLIDTSGWFCLFDESDPRHQRAVEIYGDAKSIVTHSYVTAELVALAISRRKELGKTLVFVEDILNDDEIRFIWVDEPLTWRAIELLKTRSDKKWSLCDAVSFVLMEDHGITEGLTTDHHFKQAGFVQLLDS